MTSKEVRQKFDGFPIKVVSNLCCIPTGSKEKVKPTTKITELSLLASHIDVTQINTKITQTNTNCTKILSYKWRHDWQLFGTTLLISYNDANMMCKYSADNLCHSKTAYFLLGNIQCGTYE